MASTIGISIDTFFTDLPVTLKGELFNTYGEITRNFREHKWGPTELDGGKLCEVVYSILDGYINCSYPAYASKPANMLAACQALETKTVTANSILVPRSLRIQIPRMLISLYEIRNNRGVGHVGGDIDPNNMDAACVVAMAKWIVAELIRIFHSTDFKTATNLVDSITERIIPIVWEVDGIKRVLDYSLTYKDKTLLLLYSNSQPVSEIDLYNWTEYKSASDYRSKVLRPLHKIKLIEYNEKEKIVTISPVGIKYVEEKLLK